MRYLVERNLNQSECIRLGIELENVLKDYILVNSKDWTALSEKKIARKQCDHLFLHKNTNKIIYAEIKCNLNLDTEKSLSTIQKCLLIQQKLAEKYKCDVEMFLVGLRYYKTDIIQPTIKRKYLQIHDNVIGVNEYLRLFGIDVFTDEQEYKMFVNEFVDILF